MNNDVDEIKSRLNIVDFIGEYLKLTKAGSNYKAVCPFHNEKSPSFMVSEDKQIWHCFGCGKGGDALGFLMEIESVEFREALRILAEKTGIQLQSFNPKVTEQKNRGIEILEFSTKFYETQLWKGHGKDKVMAYLRKRGLNEESIKKFRLGYAPPGWDNIIKFLTGRGYSLEEIEKTGLLVKKEGSGGFYDRFRDRVMFPIDDSFGKIIGFSARVSPDGDEKQAKYINTPETQLYHKGNVLYGISYAKQEIKAKDYSLLVEGNMDVIASHQAGEKTAVAVSGTALTTEQIRTLKRYSENLKMFFDMDEAGQNAAKKSVELCFRSGINAEIVSTKDGKDAADMVQDDPKKFESTVKESVPAPQYFLDKFLREYDKDSSQGKKRIASDFSQLIVNFESEIDRSHWIKKLAEKIEVEESSIKQLVNKSSSNSLSRPYEKSGQVNEMEGVDRRSVLIRRKLVGLLISSPSAWKSFCQKYEQDPEFKGGIFKTIFDGKKYDFKFEKLLLDLDKEASDTLSKLHFESKYQFGPDSVEELEQGEIEAQAEQYIKGYKRELQKDRLNSIIKDIKKAESQGDKETLKILMNEFSRLSRELK